MKGSALSLVLKVRVFKTRKWSIDRSRNLILVTRSRVISSIIFVFVYLLFDFIRFYTEIKNGKGNVNSLVPVKNFRHFVTSKL